MGKVIAIDFGLKRTGLAITDELKIIASGLDTVESPKLMDYLIALFQKEKIETIVLGEPKRMDGSDAHITQNVYLLKEALEKQFPGVPVVLQDERFTSKMAVNAMIAGGMKKKDRQNKAMVDKISATIILQEYLGVF
ncbi:MAG: Holliday junction resolvase RuvX [Crocinitomicaceae bacterium]